MSHVLVFLLGVAVGIAAILIRLYPVLKQVNQLRELLPPTGAGPRP